MADFVAVIRRAVDGLTDNTPEMRIKVYEKARGAVVRQLENMNPRPPEAMFKRQLDKLDAAIQQVEEENSEALPAPAEIPPADVAPAEIPAPAESLQQPLPATEPVSEEPLRADPVHEAPAEAAPAEQPPFHQETEAESPQPAYAEAAGHQPLYHEETAQAETQGYDEPVAHDEPSEAPHAEVEPQPVEAYAEPAYFEPVRDAEPVHEAEPYRHEEPAYTEEPVRHAEPVAHHAEPATPADEHEAVPAHDAAQDEDPLLSHFEPVREPAIRHAANRVMEEPLFDAGSEIPGGEQAQVPAQPDHRDVDHRVEPAAHQQASATYPAATMPDWSVDIDREPEVAAPSPDEDEQSPRMPRAALTETDVAAGFNDFLKTEFSTPAVQPPPARKEPEGDFSWDAPFDDLPDLPKPVAFEQALHARQEELAKAPERKSEPSRDARAELEDLIGYAPADADTATPGDKLPPDVTRAMSRLEGKSYKVHKKNKPKFNPIPIAFGVAGALLVTGAGYAAYTYRDDVSALVASYMPADTASVTSETRAVDGTPADETAKSVTVKTDEAAKAATETPAGEQPTEVASLDTNIVPTKFTQRLLADGSETETDAAKIPVDQSLSEGKTIAGQTEVASTDPDTAATETVAEKPGLAVAQKMFLYEERLGGSPVAVPGTVTWSLKNDTTSTAGKDQPMVEATVDVPERKLKAIVTFKRNSDVSLPASHIIEVVFDLPDDFPEGNVEGVQRVAFKQTEQDRGNGLIAVPAKITDDFHMIALNDDADARKVNGELMKTRAWIDIPIVYRNNRRALLTFEKGSTGTEAFDKALAQWAALGPTATNN